MTIQRFSELPLAADTLSDLEHLGYTTPTPIQAQALPVLLLGKDLLAKAETGSGKTAAFGIALVEAIELSQQQAQALVIAPTRELCTQITESLRSLGRSKANLRVLTLCGGVPKRAQHESLKQGVHVIVGTPGRLLDHLAQENLDFSSLKLVVFDEADRMFDMGFAPQIDELAQHFPAQHQTVLFSATFDRQAKRLASQTAKDPVFIDIAPEQTTTHLQQYLCACSQKSREHTLHQLLCAHQFESCIVFCNTKVSCHELQSALQARGHAAVTLNSDLTQGEREDILAQFANGSARVLIATDVAARGLDIDAVAGVINYEVPSDPATYTHRIGRTARAGQSGTAITLCASNETQRWERVAAFQDAETDIQSIEPPTGESSPKTPPLQTNYRTLRVLGGRKHKLRAGDLLGALTKDEQLKGDQIGKINVMQMVSYIAIERPQARVALAQIQGGKIKGKKYRAALLK